VVNLFHPSFLFELSTSTPFNINEITCWRSVSLLAIFSIGILFVKVCAAKGTIIEAIMLGKIRLGAIVEVISPFFWAVLKKSIKLLILCCGMIEKKVLAKDRLYLKFHYSKVREALASFQRHQAKS